MSRSYTDNARRIARNIPREHQKAYPVDLFMPNKGEDKPKRGKDEHDVHFLPRYGDPLRKYHADSKVKDRRIEKRRFNKILDKLLEE